MSEELRARMKSALPGSGAASYQVPEWMRTLVDDRGRPMRAAETIDLVRDEIAGRKEQRRGRREKAVPKYVIERDIPGAGKLSSKELQVISQKSCGVLSNLGPQIQWVHSYVTDDKIYCVYIAPSAEMVREHARQGGFPADRVSEVRTVIDPTTAES